MTSDESKLHALGKSIISHGKCHDCGKDGTLTDYERDAGDPPQAIYLELCGDCYEVRTER